MKRPNIIYILSDHQAYYGHKAKRPVFDAFASEGVNFECAYTACPICGPARRTMLTGLYPHRHGELRNDVNHPFDRPTYLDVLHENGYRQFYFGKWHAGEGSAHDHGCEGFSYPSYSNPYTKKEYLDYLDEMGLESPRIFVEDDFMNWGKKHRNGQIIQQDGNWCNEHSSGIMLGPKEVHESFFLAHLAKKQLQKLAEEDSEQPFHLRVDFWGPHQPYFPVEEFARLYNPNEVELPISFRENVYKNGKPRCYQEEYNYGITSGMKIRYPNPLSESTWRRVIARCYAQISMIDAATGVILDAIKECGFYENTIVIVTTDHGDALACHGGHFDKASYMPEEMLRVPLAIRYPGVAQEGKTTRALVSNLDMGPTMLDTAGLSYPAAVDGKTLLPLLKGEQAYVRNDLICETHGHVKLPLIESHLGRVLIRGEHKFVFHKGQMNELYNLKNDPWELDNLVRYPEYQHICDEMMKLLVQRCKETDDKAIWELKEVRAFLE